MRRVAVGDIMTRNIITAFPENSLYECAKKMTKENVGSLPVVVGKRLVGILTAGDILRGLLKKPKMNLRKEKCIKFASKKIAVIKPSAEISQALEKMKSLSYRRLPVISNNELLGVITLKDILSIEPELYAQTKNLIDEIKEFETKTEKSKEQWPLEGLCENCGAFSELLKVNGELLCIDCREEKE